MKEKKEMTLGETCRQLIKESADAILNTIFSLSETKVEEKPKRARGKKGRYLADDKFTKDVNEAWVGGKAPKKTRKKK